MFVHNQLSPKSTERNETTPVQVPERSESKCFGEGMSAVVLMIPYEADAIDARTPSSVLENTGSSGRLCSVDYERLAAGLPPAAPTSYESLPSGALSAVAAGKAQIEWGSKGPEDAGFRFIETVISTSCAQVSGSRTNHRLPDHDRAS